MNEATATRTDANGAGMSAIWPDSAQRDHAGAVRLHGRSVEELSASFGTPLFVMDTEELSRRALRFSRTVSNAFHDTNTHVSFAGKAFLSKEVVRIMLAQGLLVDTCSMGEMRIALAAGAPGRRLVLHGNNKSDEEIRLAVEQGFAKIVVDSPDEPARIAEIARSLGATAKVMLRVTVGVHAGGHEFISTAHEDQKFGVPLLPAGADGRLLDLDTRPDHAGSSDGHEDLQSPAQAVSSLYVPTGKRPDDDAAVTEAMSVVADGPAIGVLKDILSRQPDLELVGVHAHIGSQIHDANAFIESARRLMILRKTFWATDGFLLPETDLGGGYSVAYTDDDASMDIEDAFATMSQAVEGINRRLGLPMPVLSFEPGRWIVAPCGITLYRVGTVKPVHLANGITRTYVSVDGGMSDNIRPALYGAQYTATLANRKGSEALMDSRVVGLHCESGDILVQDVRLPADVRRGDILAIPVTGAYGRTMASNYNQIPIPAVAAVTSDDAHLMLRRQTIEDLLELDQYTATQS
ncbi:MAG: diaminopimelate decarboxylase [Bifidobacterium psychraerophilum]|uniref:diaminopimelate decarboxylase family protein n=1 Tax=Bifidobacterium psychraerophilum TaxID=218140 RepID=UPI0039EA3AE8